MSMLKCGWCDCVFDEEDGLERRVCLEDYYGVGGQFEDSTYIECIACPNCGSVECNQYEEWDSEEEEEEEEEDEE